MWLAGHTLEVGVDVSWDEGLSFIARRAKNLAAEPDERRKTPRSSLAAPGEAPLPAGLHLRLDGKEDSLEHIKGILAQAPGETGVYLHLREEANDRVFLLEAGVAPSKPAVKAELRRFVDLRLAGKLTQEEYLRQRENLLSRL